MHWIKASILLIFLLLTERSTAQNLQLGVDVGLTNYQGEIETFSNSDGLLLDLDPGIGLSLRYDRGGWLGAKVSVYAGSLSGDDARSSSAGLRRRNLSFTTPLYVLSAEAELYPIRWLRDEPSQLEIFFTLGICGYRFDPRTEYRGEEYRLQPLRTEGQGTSVNATSPYSLYSWTLPAGAGLRYWISGQMYVQLSMSYYYGQTDYLDDIGGDYVSLEVLASEVSPLSAELSYRADEIGFQPTPPSASRRGSPGAKDGFAMGKLSIFFTLGSRSISCPTF